MSNNLPKKSCHDDLLFKLLFQITIQIFKKIIDIKKYFYQYFYMLKKINKHAGFKGMNEKKIGPGQPLRPPRTRNFWFFAVCIFCLPIFYGCSQKSLLSRMCLKQLLLSSALHINNCYRCCCLWCVKNSCGDKKCGFIKNFLKSLLLSVAIKNVKN